MNEPSPLAVGRAVKVIRGISGLKDCHDSHLGYSNWMRVTQSMINQFADVTGDHQWIHSDVGRAAHGPFGDTIAHGYLTLSLIPKLLWQIYRLEGFEMEVNYGLDRVRFPGPLRSESLVRAGAYLVKVEASKGGSLATIRVELQVENSARPVCVADSLVFLQG